MNSFSRNVLSLFFLFNIILMNNAFTQDCKICYYSDFWGFGFWDYVESIEADLDCPPPSYWTFLLVNEDNSSCSILPIELTYFNAIALEDKVELNWVTSSEKNNDFFTIEKSTNGSDWEIVDEIKGVGDSRQEISYTSYDYLPFNVDTYYKLKQTDFDGQFTYSDIHIVTFNSNHVTQFYFFPNPVNDIIKIQGNHINEVVILSSIGDIVMKSVFENKQKVQLSLVKLNKGIYFIKIGEQIKKITKF